jgi:hypothetical protein
MRSYCSVINTGITLLLAVLIVLAACSSSESGAPVVMGSTATSFTTTTRAMTINSGSVNVDGPPPPAYTPTIGYGDQPNQFGKLRTPGLLPPEVMPPHSPFPIVVLIHG